MEKTTTAAKPNAATLASKKLNISALADVPAVNTGGKMTNEMLDTVLGAIVTAVKAINPCLVTLTPAQRKLLVGAQTRNHGFIEVAYHSAVSHAELVPVFLTDKFAADMKDFENKLVAYDYVEQLLTLVGNTLAVSTDTAYRDALGYYDALKNEAKFVPGAEIERDRLADYFKKPLKSKGGEVVEEVRETVDVTVKK